MVLTGEGGWVVLMGEGGRMCGPDGGGMEGAWSWQERASAWFQSEEVQSTMSLCEYNTEDMSDEA